MKPRNEWLQIGRTVLIAIIVAMIFRFYLFSPIIVDGPSMQSTLQNGDHMIVNKFSYKIGDPKRFDIVVFHATDEKDFIKRIIGLPGETVSVEDDDLYINGEFVAEDFLDKLSPYVKNQYGFTLEDVTNVQVIPEDYYFVMGDNRNDSTDSRMIGLIHRDEIVGKTKLIYWPLKRIGFVE